MISDGQSQDQILSQIIAQCYDRFSICLSEMQVSKKNIIFLFKSV